MNVLCGGRARLACQTKACASIAGDRTALLDLRYPLFCLARQHYGRRNVRQQSLAVQEVRHLIATHVPGVCVPSITSPSQEH